MKKSITVMALLLTTSGIFALSTDTATFSGSVTAVNQVSVSNVNTTLTLGASETAVTVFNITGSNNASTGFKLSFSSANTGQLRNPSYNVSKPGTFLSYTMDVVESTPPTTTKTSSILTGLILSTEKSVSYNLSVDDATVNAIWAIKINYAAKALLASTFSDTITVTISNI